MRTIQVNTKSLVGLDEIQATKLINAAGGHVNIVMVDGIPCKTTSDFRLDRVNLELRAGKVTRATIG